MPRSLGEYGPETYGDRIAEKYEEFYGDGLQTDETVAFLTEIAGDGPVLELGIGTGRVALPLAVKGLEVHGIDASQRMIDQLRSKPGGDQIAISTSDMKDVDAPSDQYSLIYVMFNTFYAMLKQEDQMNCFSRVAERLEPGGRFVVRGFVPDLARYTRRQVITVTDLSAGELRTDYAKIDPVTQIIKSQHVIITNDQTAIYPAFLRYCWPGELALMARIAGLELENRWEDWAKNEFNSQSGMLISVYRKPG